MRVRVPTLLAVVAIVAVLFLAGCSGNGGY
jgi:hypothetical protein